MKTLDEKVQHRQDERLNWLFHLDRKTIGHLVFDKKNEHPIWDKVLEFENLKQGK